MLYITFCWEERILLFEMTLNFNATVGLRWKSLLVFNYFDEYIDGRSSPDINLHVQFL